MVKRGELALLVAITLLSARNVEAQYVLVGAGASDDSCGNWIQARRSNNSTVEMMYLSWVQGFLSGKNGAAIEGEVHIPAPTVISAHLDRECAKSPTLPVFIAADSLFFQLQRQQGKVIPKK